jgi:hypothetical protein
VSSSAAQIVATKRMSMAQSQQAMDRNPLAWIERRHFCNDGISAFIPRIQHRGG